MKKTPILIMMVLLCTSLAFSQNTGAGVISEITGTVELKHAGSSDFIAAKPGDTVAQNTVVSTGFKSSALITIGSSVITVRPLTRLTLGEITASSGTETINVSLQTGRVRVDVNPPAGTRANMTVQSPVATASVRGTSFEFDTQTVTVLNGTVAFQGSSGKPKMVNAGSVSQVTDNGRATDPAETHAAELQPRALAGSETGFRRSVIPVKGEVSFTLIMN